MPNMVTKNKLKLGGLLLFSEVSSGAHPLMNLTSTAQAGRNTAAIRLDEQMRRHHKVQLAK